MCLSLFASDTDHVQPEIIQKNDVKTYIVENGILSFSSEESYELLLENQDVKAREAFIQSLNQNDAYTSLKKRNLISKGNAFSRTLTQAEEEVAETNEFLGTLLNEDGLIAIGDRLFRVDLSEELVYAGHKDSVTVEEFKLGMASASKNKALLAFSTDDDVLDLLNAGVRGTVSSNARTIGTGGSATTFGLFCSEDGAPERKPKQDEEYMIYDGYRYRVDAKHAYQKAGIYFSLMSELKHMRKAVSAGELVTWSQYNTDISLTYTFKYKPKCRTIVDYSTRVAGGWDNKVNVRPYESSRGLHAYYIHSDYVFAAPSGQNVYLTWLNENPARYRY